MKAAYYEEFGGPDVLTVGDLPVPMLAQGGVMIDVKAASVIPGDWRLRSGELKHLFPVTFPKVPGRDGAGVVRAVADGVASLAPGDPVCFISVHTEQGTCAGQICRPEKDVVAMPPGLSFAEGAALMHAGVCAWICLESGEVGSGTTVLVQGGGGAIGGAALQIAHHLGAEVTTTCNSRNRDHCLALGADRVIAYDRQDFADTDQRYDVVIDLIGGEVHRRSYEVLKAGGKLVYLLAAPIEDLSAQYGVETILGPIREERAIHDKIVELVVAGVLRPLISEIMPLEKIGEAHNKLATGQVSRGRIVIDIAGADTYPVPGPEAGRGPA